MKNHTFHIVIILLVSLTIGSILVGALISRNPLINSFDRYLYIFITSSLQSSYLDNLIKPFNFNWVDWAGPMPTYLYVLVLGGFTYLYFKSKEDIPWYLYSIIVGSLIAYLITALDWRFAFRERPFHFLPNQVSEIGKLAWGSLSSYPSGHARETALYSTLIYHYIPSLKRFLITFVIFIAFSRVYIGAHYPTDAIAGVIIGVISAKATILLILELQKIFRQRRLL